MDFDVDVDVDVDLQAMPDIEALSDDELDRLIDELAAVEKEISARRCVVQGTLDLARAERRLRPRSLRSLAPDELAAILAWRPGRPLHSRRAEA